MRKEEAIEYWYLAVNSQYGIRLETNNPKNLMNRLYAVRAEIQDPALAEFSLAPDRLNPTGALLIVRTHAIIEEPTDGSPES